MTYVLLLVAFWLGMLVERNFVKEADEAEPKTKAKVGDLYSSRYNDLRFRVAATYSTAIMVEAPQPPDGPCGLKTALGDDGELGPEWTPID